MTAPQAWELARSDQSAQLPLLGQHLRKVLRPREGQAKEVTHLLGGLLQVGPGGVHAPGRARVVGASHGRDLRTGPVGRLRVSRTGHPCASGRGSSLPGLLGLAPGAVGQGAVGALDMVVPVRRRGMPRRPGGVRPVRANLRPIHATGLGLAHATSLSPVRVTGVRPTGTESVHAGLQPRALSRL